MRLTNQIAFSLPPAPPVPRVTMADDKKIIEAVCGYPCLWQVCCTSYKDARAREHAWMDVASKVRYMKEMKYN